MALATDEMTLNALVDALIDGWVVFINAIGANERIQIVRSAPMKGNLAADSTQGTAANLKASFDFGRHQFWTNNPNTADNVPISIGGQGLFFKVTNGAGDLSG
jgi:hypothetical protein